MKRLILIIFFSLLYGLAFAEEAEIVVNGDYVERIPELSVVIAKGNVEVIYMDVRIWADEVHMNTETKDVVATGNVVVWELSKDELGKGNFVKGYMKCDKLEFNMDTKKGVAYRARGYLDPFYYYEGSKVTKVDEDVYNVENGTITTCTSQCGMNPDWRLAGKRIVIKTESYTRIFGLTGWIKSIPVLFSPYLQTPSKSERKSGVLVPTFGYKTNDKIFVKVPVYFVIDRSSDLTLWFTPYSSGSLGTAFEYRNVFSPGEKLRLKGDYIQEKDKSSRWSLSGRFNRFLGVDTELKGSVDIKNTSYRKYYSESFSEYSQIYSDSILEFLKRTDYTSLNVIARYQSDNLSGVSQKLYRIPELNFSLFPIRTGIINDLFIGGYSGALVYKEKNGNSNLDFTLTRFILDPRLYLPFSIGGMLRFLPTYSYSYTYWSKSLDKNGRVSGDSLSREISDFRFYTRGPIVMRPYSLPILGELFHFVIPEVRYVYVPNYGDRKRVIVFDDRDTLSNINTLTYSLANRFITISGNQTKEIARFIVEQDYRFNSLGVGSRKLTDVRFIFDLYPGNFYLNTRLFYNVYGRGIPTKAITIGYSGDVVRDWRGNVNLNYYEDNTAGSRYMEYSAGFGTGSFDFNFALRRDVKLDYWPEKTFYLGYVKGCWALRVGYRILDTTPSGGRSDKTIYFIVLFKGLGTLGNIDDAGRAWINNIVNRWKVRF